MSDKEGRVSCKVGERYESGERKLKENVTPGVERNERRAEGGERE